MDQQTDSQAGTETLTIADLFQLTVYDASYLESSGGEETYHSPRSIKNSAIRTAAIAFGVKLVDS
jgi:hypothetical protein